jgi:hypothetical protein
MIPLALSGRCSNRLFYMSMFSNLMNKVFGRSNDAPEKAAVEETAPGDSKSAKSEVEAVGEHETVAVSPQSSESAYGAVAETAVEPVSEVDVEAMLNDLAEKSSEKLDWKVSIVDLLKLLDLDSSYATRKEMALELGYSESDIDSKGSAEMNIWLHKQVLQRIAANGGKLPDDLLS